MSVWNSISPDGSKSVKQNTAPMAQNTSYTETQMNKDHFWNVGTDEDGHHRSVQMENYADTAIGAPVDAPLATGMDGAIYLKTTAGRVQGFYRNTVGIYQFIPAFVTGSVALLNSGYTNIVALPDNCYGHIWVWRQGNNRDGSAGWFHTQSGVCQAYSSVTQLGPATDTLCVKYGNDTNASGLNFRARLTNAVDGTYFYRIMYWTV